MNKSFLKFTDLTLPAICSGDYHPDRSSLINFCRLLKEMGVDLIEIDTAALQQIGEIPAGLDFSFRIGSRDDVALVLNTPIRHCVMRKEFLSNTGAVRKLAFNRIKTTLEVEVDPAGAPGLPKWTEYPGWPDSIRITGVNKIASLPHIKDFIAACRDCGIHTDLCADNLFDSATAIAVDAALNGIDTVTCSFLGYGGRNGYAVLEEVLVAVRIITGREDDRDLTLLPQISRLMTDMTGLIIPDNKPVVGSGLFKYESGIHADGIHKNPATYEPFDPAWVGQNRSLAIGKHSGRNSVISKLNELNILFQSEDIPAMVARVREQSIKMRRDLDDEEIKQIGDCFL
jgi:homocitrate synthase NifV